MAKIGFTRSETTQKILKVLGIFGGVQAVSMLCAVVRTKLAALWLGPAGVGLLAVYVSTMDMISKTAQLNVDQSAVRDLARDRSDTLAAARTMAVVRRLAMVLGIGGTVLVALCSPLISLWAFGDYSHTTDFALLSLWVFFAIVTAGEFAILRGFDTLRPLAKASLWGAVSAVTVAIPLLFFMRVRGIVPMLLVYYGLAFAFALVYRYRRPGMPRVRVSLREALGQGGPMLRLGAYMTVSLSITLLASNVLIIYLSRQCGEAAAGCYQAGYTLINTYVGIIFTAIVMEYYPRLSTVAHSRMRTEVVVSHEMKVTLWILIPVMVAFICCSGLAIELLYSSKFMDALPYVTLGASGVFFRAASWCLAYTILAKGDGRMYVVTECASAVAYLALHIPLYNAFGFSGLGAAYTLWYLIYFVIVYAVYRLRYGMRLRRGIAALLACGVGLSLITLAGVYSAGPWITLAVVLVPASLAALRRLR